MTRLSWVCWFACWAGLGACAAAQDGEAVIRAEARLVEIPATVLDHKGRYVDGLRAELFSVADNGVAQRLVVFEGNDDGLSCAILLDTTASMASALPNMKNAVLRMIEQMREQDSVAVYGFDTSLRTLLNFTTDKRPAKAAVTRTRAAGATALFDAIAEAVREMSGRAGKKVLVVFTDGDDNSSVLNSNNAILRARKEGIPIYTVAEGEALHSKKLIEELTEISAVSGGLTYEIKKPHDAAKVFLDISEDMKHTYLLAYRPPEAGNKKWRTIYVAVSGKEKYSVRAREGYYPK